MSHSGKTVEKYFLTFYGQTFKDKACNTLCFFLIIGEFCDKNKPNSELILLTSIPSVQEKPNTLHLILLCRKPLLLSKNY